MPTTLNYRADNSNAPGEHPIYAFTPGDKSGPRDWMSETAPNGDILASKTNDFATQVKKTKAVTVAFYQHMTRPKYTEGDDIKMFRLLIYDPGSKNQTQPWKQILFPKAKVKRVRDVTERDPLTTKVPARYREVVFTVNGLDVFPPA